MTQVASRLFAIFGLMAMFGLGVAFLFFTRAVQRTTAKAYRRDGMEWLAKFWESWPVTMILKVAGLAFICLVLAIAALFGWAAWRH